MSDRRIEWHMVALIYDGDHWNIDESFDAPQIVLPDAEHVHLHRQPDGTWTAVPMTRVDTITQNDGTKLGLFNPALWVDSPEETP